MAARVATSKGKLGNILGFNRWIHLVPRSPSLSGSIDLGVRSPQPILLEFSCPSFSFGGSMELMAVPKKKVSPHKRGIRNGLNALNPVPVLVLCKSCGCVRLPHFFCCGGKPNKDNTDKQNGKGTGTNLTTVLKTVEILRFYTGLVGIWYYTLYSNGE
ncbi:hypothetical protein RJT34_12757 [Clitoria ternatea]|uniref:Large ribosomal subunit protein bL32m n=1 Tax=Clitoria ternatea TaxID=43366 RepID=A0AAN9PJM0_CLITE